MVGSHKGLLKNLKYTLQLHILRVYIKCSIFGRQYISYLTHNNAFFQQFHFEPRGMGWGGRWEGGSGWGTHVNSWLIHVNVKTTTIL